MSQLLLSRSPYRNSLRSTGFNRSAISRNISRWGGRGGIRNPVQSVARVKISIGPTAVIAGLLFFAVLFSVLQLIQYNKIATLGYEVTKLEIKRKQLLTEYERRNMELTQMQSLSYLTTTAKVVGMQPQQSSHVEFLRGNTAVAVK